MKNKLEPEQWTKKKQSNEDRKEIQLIFLQYVSTSTACEMGSNGNDDISSEKHF